MQSVQVLVHRDLREPSGGDREQPGATKARLATVAHPGDAAEVALTECKDNADRATAAQCLHRRRHHSAHAVTRRTEKVDQTGVGAEVPRGQRRRDHCATPGVRGVNGNSRVPENGAVVRRQAVWHIEHAEAEVCTKPRLQCRGKQHGRHVRTLITRATLE